VNGSGRTLYLFEKDKRGKSACSAACAMYWPPLITHGKAMAAGRCQAGTARDDQALEWLPPGELCRTSGLHVLAGHEARADQGRGIHALRRRLGCTLARRQEDRE